MTLVDPIGDMFTRIRNGQMRNLNSVNIPASKFRTKILEILKTEGYINNFYLESSENNKKVIKINLKYYEGTPVIKEIKRISKPGRRVYSRATSIPKIQNGLGMAIISTSQGVMSDIDARKNNVGGKLFVGVLMSKIGKYNFTKSTSIKVDGDKITVTGPKGNKSLFINEKVFSSKVNEKNEFQILPLKKEVDHKTQLLWGTYRSLINNAIIGVSTGHEKILELNGVGFRANLKGETLNLQIGFSHDVNFKFPKDVKIQVEKQTIIKINGVDKELVSKIASDIKSLKPVEPYKGKGIKERNQYVLRKEGKKK